MFNMCVILKWKETTSKKNNCIVFNDVREHLMHKHKIQFTIALLKSDSSSEVLLTQLTICVD